MRWNLDSGFCPHGHELKVCHRVTKTGTNLCRITASNNAINFRLMKKEGRSAQLVAVQRPAKRRKHRETQREAGTFTPPGAIRQRVGTHEHAGCKPFAFCQLVCTHWIKIRRTSIRADGIHIPDQLMCDRCGDWKWIHQVSAADINERSFVYYPLEIPRPIWPHVKNAGSGRA